MVFTVLFAPCLIRRKLLNDNESVALDLHPHWWFFAKHAAALVVSIIVGIAAKAWLDGSVERVVGVDRHHRHHRRARSRWLPVTSSG